MLFRFMIVCLAARLATDSAAAAAEAKEAAPTTLDPAYVDGSFGFSVRPFAGATALRQKRVLSVADVEIVQFVRLDEKWSLTVRLTSTTRPLDASLIIDGITSSLRSQHEDVKQLRGEAAQIASRDGVRYAASFSIEGNEWLRQQAVIRTKPTEYFALVLVTPLSARAKVEPLFDQIVDSFQLLRSELGEKRLKATLERGTQLLERAARGEIRLTNHVVPETYMRFLLEGKEIGYVQILEKSRPRGPREGVEIREWAWLFQPDGTRTHLRHSMYVTNDLSYESWENRVTTIPPTPAGVTPQVHLQVDSGLREEDKLIIAYTPQPNSPDLVDRVLDVEPSYASAAWSNLLPRLLDLKTPQSYSFSSYNADRRGLVIRSFQVVGPTQITLNTRTVRAIKIEDSEGFIPPVNEVNVDDKGRLLRVVAGPLEMLSTTRDEIERAYAARVKEAQEILNKYPLQEPRPVSRQRGPSTGVTLPE